MITFSEGERRGGKRRKRKRKRKREGERGIYLIHKECLFYYTRVLTDNAMKNHN